MDGNFSPASENERYTERNLKGKMLLDNNGKLIQVGHQLWEIVRTMNGKWAPLPTSRVGLIKIWYFFKNEGCCEAPNLVTTTPPKHNMWHNFPSAEERITSGDYTKVHHNTSKPCFAGLSVPCILILLRHFSCFRLNHHDRYWIRPSSLRFWGMCQNTQDSNTNFNPPHNNLWYIKIATCPEI